MPDKRGTYTALDGRFMSLTQPTTRRTFSDTGSESSFTSGGSASGESHTGLLSQEKPPTPRMRRGGRRRARLFDFSHAMRRRRLSRAFPCLLATALVAFVVFLLHLKAVSEAEIRMGWKTRPTAPAPAWEAFPFLERYYGGVKALVDRGRARAEYPDRAKELDIGSKTGAVEKGKRGSGRGTVPFPPESLPDVMGLGRKQCFLDREEKIAVPSLQMHDGVPEGFPDPVIGSYEMFGLQNTGCFDRYGRLGPYGFGYSKKYGGIDAGMEGEGREEAMKSVWGDRFEIDYGKVSWADAQVRCAEKHRDRFRQAGTARNHSFTAMEKPAVEASTEQAAPKLLDDRDLDVIEAGTFEPGSTPTAIRERLPRTAVLIRTWTGYEYDEEDIVHLRALVNELSLQSGGEYTVHFLIHVKDNDQQIWADEDTYQRVVDAALPAEFRGMGTLWSERQMALIYGGIAETMFRDLAVHGVYRSTYMPVQYFAHMHPEYDHFWQWEMDVRYVGHYYELFSKLGSWAKKQPRKGLWERNGRFYIPSEHGTWEEFSHMVRVQTEHGTGSRGNMYHKMSKDPKHPDQAKDNRPETPIWGALRPANEDDHFEVEKDPVPPTELAEDKSNWGVGEEADFITLNPLFDPANTDWLLSEDTTGYNATGGAPPRRAAIITTSRLSRRLLEVMHRETALKRHSMFSEMWPGSCALHHGLKAVYAPHPVYIDRRWPTSYLAAIYNNGRNGAAGGSRTSIFSDERQHNFLGTSWYYHAGFPANLWKRWLGYKVNNDGGEQAEKAGEGRICLPSMLLHPVKQVDLVS